MGKDILIVGTGLFGATCARVLTDRGFKCYVIDKRDRIGGSCYTEMYDGIEIHKYGIHIFHTNNDDVMSFIKKHTTVRDYKYKTLVNIRDKLYSFPINLLTLNQVFGVLNVAEAKVKMENPETMNTLHNMFFKDYSEKQWGMPYKDIPAEIAARIPIRMNYDDTYFHNAKYECLPDYALLFKSLLCGSEVMLERDYYFLHDDFVSSFDHIIFTGCIDEYFGYNEGELGYRSLTFEAERYECADIQGCISISTPSKDVDYTRTIEYKHLDKENHSKHTILIREYPKGAEYTDERFYPIVTMENKELYQKYKKMSSKLKNIHFGGRLGSFEYINMDETILKAINLTNKI